jgi:hypothetical protein
LEKGMGKESGSLDRDQLGATTLRESDFLDLLRRSTPELQARLMKTAEMLADLGPREFPLR